MRRTQEDAELTRQSLLEAALEVFSQKGYASTRLEDVAEAAGVTRGAIYHHFGGKKELFHALFEEASASGDQTVQRAIAEGGSFLDITRRVLVYSLELLQKNSQFRRITALYLFNAGSSPELADFQRQRGKDMKQQMEGIVGFFQTALAQGEVRSDLDPQIAARAFLAYQNGLMLLWLLNPKLVSIENDAQALADVFIRGIDRGT
jgi:AcrR family transcriptional regulator